MDHLASQLLVLVTVAFVVWVSLLLLLRPVHEPMAGVVAALLSWALASASVPWLVGALQHHHVWPLL